MPLANASQFTQVNQTNFDQVFAPIKGNDAQFVTLHWTVGNYNQLFDDYHFVIDGAGTIWMNNAGWDEQGLHKPLNHIGHGGNPELDPLAHTWHRNTGNIGISWCAMIGASMPIAGYEQASAYTFPPCYGSCPPTKAQVDSMSWLVAMLVRHYGLTFDKVRSHYDWAVLDGYPGERWDLKYEKASIIAKAEQIFQATKPTQGA
jgi:hypothetical protein